MADITDPEAIRFVNDYIRPMCENLRYMCARGKDWKIKWDGGLSADFPNDTSPVVDGRDAEGISRLTGADIQAVSAVFSTLLADIDAAAEAAINKPCVRPLLYSPSE
tara:strand:- start:1460 stop:1780 length:321 start_codon:yes stop_codon:yes gene_type:complete